VSAARATVVANEIEAELLCSQLRAEGIECFSKRTNFGAGAADGGSSFTGPFEIWVNEADVERARELLAE
jgi:hypothetical protein